MRENDLSDSLIERAKSTAADEKRRASVWQAGKSCPLKEMNLSGINYETGERGLRLLAGLLFEKI